MKIIKFQGGLGNQMFIYCFYKELKHLGYEVKADITFYDDKDSGMNLHNGYQLEKVFGLKLDFATQKEINEVIDYFPLKRVRRKMNLLKPNVFIEDIFKFNENVFDNKYTYYEGYFQDIRYFSNVKNNILEDFKIKNIPNIEIKPNSVSIHIRRTDYVGNSLLGGISTEEYYQKAIKYVRNIMSYKPIFYIFSDDIGWVKNNIKIEGEVHYIKEECLDYQAMYLMSQCDYNILANSSFSWWGAFLNKNVKEVIVPNKYYTKGDKKPYLKNWKEVF